MSDVVRYEREGPVAVITVANPPVNALGQAVRQGLWDAADRFAEDDAQIALILGEGRLFIGGADISEFGKPPTRPFLPDTCTHIERSPKPVVAAVHGPALGGGCEVALGAHYRLAMKDARFGFPEVKLGLIPGAGGSQRMPRLTGVGPALDMMPAGGSVSAEEALRIGLVDRLGEGDDVRAAGLAYAQELLAAGAPVRPVGALPRPAYDAEAFEAARALWARKARGEVAPLRAIDAVDAATKMDLDQGVQEERRIFLELMETPQRAGLIHAFFNDRKVSKLPEIDGIAPRDVAQVGVIGGGTMGAGIATACLLSGLSVTLIERDDTAADKARQTITGNLDGAVKRGKLTEAQQEATLARLQTVTDYAALSDADLAIEAVFEDMGVKKEVFAQLDAVMKPGAILATNTSYLDIDAIAQSTSRAADVIGLHFFSPAHVMKLLEVVVPDATAPDVTATAFALAKRLGKVAVRAGVCDGFIGNRILATYRGAADRLILDGASPWEIDAAIKAFGLPMGPFEMGDLAGLDIGYMTRQRKAATRDPRDVVPTWADAMYHKGWLGQKTGQGYYTYDGRKGTPNEAVMPLIEEARGNRPQRGFTPEEIQRFYMAAMVNEAAKVVGEGIAQRPLDVDVTLLYGYGFPRWRGGPMHWADTVGLGGLLADIRLWADADPYFWQPAPLLERLVAEGRSFADLNTEAA